MTASAPAIFTFDEATHTYRLNGQVLLTTTQVIKDNGFINVDYATERDRTRGTAVHLACHYFDQGKLDWDTLHKDLHGYVRSWEKMREFYQLIEILYSEKPMYHPRRLYAGTLDRDFLVQEDEWVVDIKTGDAEPWHGYQLASYDDLLGPRQGNARRRFGAYLHADGSRGTLKEFTDYDDFAVFSAMLLCTRARIKHRIKQGETNVAHNGNN